MFFSDNLEIYKNGYFQHFSKDNQQYETFTKVYFLTENFNKIEI
ncbi:hypothetical protein B4088_1110 [Bacillus cereus]|uniref:Uncharacterized protein n=1 Tax=Bacillus cereus TaxID=1396 RepID=A0A164Q8N6_BACCE|nr:hypothetical protein B4088_1110 [Bacillus cereus]